MYLNWRFSVETFASKSDMYIGHYWDAMKTIPKIHQLNPNYLGLLYRNIRSIWNVGHGEYDPYEYKLFFDNGWVMRDAEGTIILTEENAIMVDVGNPNYQKWLANWYKSYLDDYGMNGAYLDNCLASYEIMWATSQTPINPRTGKAWTNQEFKAAMIAIVNKVKDTIGSRLVVGNGIFNGQHFFDSSRQQTYIDLLNSKIDGVVSEGWISSRGSADWYSEDKWLESVDMVAWLEKNLSNKILIVCAENAGLEFSGGQLPDGTYPTNLPTGVTKEQYGTYVFASLLLAAIGNKTYINFGYYLPEDYPQSLFKIELGNPMGAYYIVAGTDVYVRDFSKVKVLVNPTYSSYSVTLDGNYETFSGAKAPSSITVAPHTGVILKRL
jgi:hypothetical protein